MKYVVSKAPLRIGLGGGGTDIKEFYSIHNGAVVNMTISRYAYASVTENSLSDNTIIDSCDLHKRIFVDLNCDLRSGELYLLEATFRHACVLFNKGELVPLSIKTYIDSPIGSGLGSSSTLVVALLKALSFYFNYDLNKTELAETAYYIERILCGFSGGKQDQFSASFGGLNFIEFNSDDSVNVQAISSKGNFVNKLESSILLYFTGASRVSSMIIDNQIQNLKSNNAQSVEAMKVIMRQAYNIRDSIMLDDFRSFTHYFNVNWENKKKTGDSISNDFINELIEEAVSLGAYGAKVSGAGGGGFIVLLVDIFNRKKLKDLLFSKGGFIYEASLDFDGARIVDYLEC